MLTYIPWWFMAIVAFAPSVLSNRYPKEEVSYSTQNDVFVEDVLMPNVLPSQNDEYFCTAKPVTTLSAYITQIEAKAEARKAHHILLFGCDSVPSRKLAKSFWHCSEGSLCSGMRILFAWAKNAPPTSLPQDVGFQIGNEAGINYLILQVHYALPLHDADDSGLRLHITYKPQKFVAGILLMVAMSTVIPPYQEKVHSDINCLFKSNVPIHPFAYRVHAHQLGVVIAGYKVNTKTGEWILLGKGNPQWPQAFYPMKETFTVEDSDILAARCTFNSSNRNRTTYIGNTANDEMCNFYIMYYTTKDADIRDTCSDTQLPELVKLMPAQSDVPLPPNPLLEQHALGQTMTPASGATENNTRGALKTSTEDARPGKWTVNKKGNGVPGDGIDPYDVSRGRIHHVSSPRPEEASFWEKESDPDDQQQQQGKFLNLFGTADQHESLYNDVVGWPKLKRQLGQVSGVTLNSKGNVVIFHRGPAVWGHMTFDIRNRYQGNKSEPIPVDTVLTIDQHTGELLSSWGRNLFFMPHGISLDANDNIWVTDVALHQVIKYPADGGVTPSLTLGERFVPGRDNNHFCKPSSIVIAKTGEFFIADGYCNSRVLKYSSKGELLLEWGQKTTSLLGIKLRAPPPYAFDVPHRLALAEDKDLILVADRENGRIQSFHISNGTFHSKIQDPEFGGRLFSVAYSSANGGTVFAVNGPAVNIWRRGIKGFVIQLSSQKTLGYFTPSEKAMSNPHDVIATANGIDVYVAEIGPNRIWKFEKSKEYGTSRILPGDHSNTEEQTVGPTNASSHLQSVVPTAVLTKLPASLKAVDDSKITNEKSSLFGVTNLTASMIIMALLAIPILLVIFVAVFVRLKKQGKFYACNIAHVKGWMTGYKNPNSDRFGIGNILNPHKGFDRVNIEDSDVDSHSSESDVEEYSAKGLKA